MKNCLLVVNMNRYQGNFHMSPIRVNGPFFLDTPSTLRHEDNDKSFIKQKKTCGMYCALE
jgi:hypothetical protein